MAAREQSVADALESCAVGGWTAEDERTHREQIRSDPKFGMFRDHREERRPR